MMLAMASGAASSLPPAQLPPTHMVLRGGIYSFSSAVPQSRGLSLVCPDPGPSSSFHSGPWARIVRASSRPGHGAGGAWWRRATSRQGRRRWSAKPRRGQS
jgi:hypothetical protein